MNNTVMGETSLILSLQAKLKELVQKDPSCVTPDIEKLVQRGLTLTLEELSKMNPISTGASTLYWVGLIMLKYDASSPLEYEWGTWAYTIIVTAATYATEAEIRCLLGFYNSAFRKEVLNTKTLESLRDWIETLKKMKQKSLIGVEDLCIAVSFQFTMLATPILSEIRENPLEEKMNNLLRVIIAMSDCEIEIESLKNSAVMVICDYLQNKYDVYGLKRSRGIEVNLNYHESEDTAFLLSQLKILDCGLKSRVNYLNEMLYHDKSIINDPEHKVNQYSVNFSEIEYEKVIYANDTNRRFGVTVSKCNKPRTDLAVKEYLAKINIKDLEDFNKEMQIMNILSARSSPENCFLKYYGYAFKGNKLSLCMEYHPSTLMTKISELKEEGKEFSAEYLLFHLPKLISSFAIMEQMNIYHQDIKPHNILITDDGFLKIIDFGVAALKESIDMSINPTGINFIQGTKGYMAPELMEAFKNLKKGEKPKVRYRKGKADVFSLGITILQMCTLEDLYTLNLKENHWRLIDKVTTVKLEWIKSLLFWMLSLNYNDRPSFKQCLNLLPGSFQTEKN